MGVRFLELMSVFKPTGTRVQALARHSPEGKFKGLRKATYLSLNEKQGAHAENCLPCDWLDATQLGKVRCCACALVSLNAPYCAIVGDACVGNHMRVARMPVSAIVHTQRLPAAHAAANIACAVV